MNIHHQLHRLKVRRAAKALRKAEQEMRATGGLASVAAFAAASSAHYVAKHGPMAGAL